MGDGLTTNNWLGDLKRRRSFETTKWHRNKLQTFKTIQHPKVVKLTSVQTSDNKQQLSQSLVDAVSSLDSNGNIPHPHYVTYLRAQAEITENRILLRINRSP